MGHLSLVLIAEMKANLRRVGGESFDWITEVQHAAVGADVVSSFVVEVGEGDGGHAHAAGARGLHRFTDHLSCRGNGNQIKVFAECADQDRFPETLDGVFRLAVLVQPVLKGPSRVTLRAEGERGQGA